MKLFRLGLAAVMLLSVLFILGCGGGSQPYKCGKFSNGTYTNSYFNLEIDLPGSWHVADDEDKEAMVVKTIEATAQALFGDSPQTDAYVDEAVEQLNEEEWANIYLLYTSKYVPEYWSGGALGANPCLTISANDISEYGQGVSGENMLNTIKLVMGETATYSDIHEESIDGIIFYVMDMTYDLEGTQATTRSYSHVQGEYELRIQITYSDLDSLQELEAIIATLRFQS